mmetsp:Transcript_75200/g.220458  ORF Transcript_75200/g.220458 Transcript_75200/m.220458 type:complete len:493 (-) Transcript_75200:280-1758(-)
MESTYPQESQFLDMVHRSNSLPYNFPADTLLVQLQQVAPEDRVVLGHCAAGVHPLADGKLISLLEGFLAIKQAHGSAPERVAYAALSARGLVDRLLKKRPLAFYTCVDKYLLRTGERGPNGVARFEAIGTPEEEHPFSLESLLSYDEMPMAALLGVWVPTLFVNSGHRRNMCQTYDEPFERTGVLCGLVGARMEFERRNSQMEAKHMLVTPVQNTSENGYGADAPLSSTSAMLGLWANFYGLEQFPTYAEAIKDSSGRYIEVMSWCYECRDYVNGSKFWDGGCSYCESCMLAWYGGDLPVEPEPSILLDTQVFKERIRLVVEPFLVRSDQVARMEGSLAYCRVKGLGLGVWQIDPRQEDLMLEVYSEILGRRLFHHTLAVDFAWFPTATCLAGVKDGEVFPGTNVRILFTKSGFASRLPSDLGQGKVLLCAMYAWDSNSWPGNEWWLGNMGQTDDSAAASCSYISTLQNPDVNPLVGGSSLLVLSNDMFTPL